jgi:hypothetical protein
MISQWNRARLVLILEDVEVGADGFSWVLAGADGCRQVLLGVGGCFYGAR